jgi:hypothetical protein
MPPLRGASLFLRVPQPITARRAGDAGAFRRFALSFAGAALVVRIESARFVTAGNLELELGHLVVLDLEIGDLQFLDELLSARFAASRFTDSARRTRKDLRRMVVLSMLKASGTSGRDAPWCRLPDRLRCTSVDLRRSGI